MQSVICAAKPRSYIVAKREARATSIRLEGGQAPPTTAGRGIEHLAAARGASHTQAA